MDEVTGIQRRVFDFVRDKLVAGRPAPTAREVAAAFGWSSNAQVSMTTSSLDRGPCTIASLGGLSTVAHLFAIRPLVCRARSRGQDRVIIGAAPFVLAMLAMIAILSYWPQLALWLPRVAAD